MKRYGLLITKLLSTAGLDKLIEDYAKSLDPPNTAKYSCISTRLAACGRLRNGYVISRATPEPG
jgi:hypothetical protein